MVNPPLTLLVAWCAMQASGGMVLRARCGSMTMATRSGPATGDRSIAEIKEFAGFSAATQRYIRRSLDIGLERDRSEERTSELQSLMRISYAVFCLKKKNHTNTNNN